MRKAPHKKPRHANYDAPSPRQLALIKFQSAGIMYQRAIHQAHEACPELPRHIVAALVHTTKALSL